MQLAVKTGGYATEVSTKQEMIGAATQFAHAIRSVYTLFFEATAKDSQVQDVRVELRRVDRHSLVLQVPNVNRCR